MSPLINCAMWVCGWQWWWWWEDTGLVSWFYSHNYKPGSPYNRSQLLWTGRTTDKMSDRPTIHYTSGGAVHWSRLITTISFGLRRAWRRAYSRLVIVWRKAWDLSSLVTITRLSRTCTIASPPSVIRGRLAELLRLLVSSCVDGGGVEDFVWG